MKKRKIAALCAVVALAAVAVVGTMAYFTSTDSASNTFTVGDIDITLDETEVNPDGTAVTPANRVQENEYKLFPGHTYIKDPTVHVTKGSEECYVRMLVKVNNLDDLKAAIMFADHPEYYTADSSIFLLEKLVSGWDSTKWTTNATWAFDATTSTYQFRYYQTVTAGTTTDTDLEALFSSFTVPGFLTQVQTASMANASIDITAQAIQADGFADADAAWAAWTD